MKQKIPTKKRKGLRINILPNLLADTVACLTNEEVTNILRQVGLTPKRVAERLKKLERAVARKSNSP